jgi:hypothetical protein
LLLASASLSQRAAGIVFSRNRLIESQGCWWSDPLVNGSDSELIFEWWHHGKKVTIYFSDTVAEFIKGCGADMDSEMEEGIVQTNEQIRDLWNWLAS